MAVDVYNQPACWRRSLRTLLAMVVLVGAWAPSVLAGETHLALRDPECDQLTRRTDPGGTASFDPSAHRLIDMLELTIGRWTATAAHLDVFDGAYDADGVFMRMDLTLAGLVNPPGSVDPLHFAPYAFGDHPVYGFIEIDMDDDDETGGELDAPEFRYLGNVARFGGMPSEELFNDRVAEDASAFDGNFLTEPYVERHGEEFHLALLGGQFSAWDIVEVVGNGDALFDAGETWNIEAPWFHRAHGYEPFSLMSGGAAPGEYVPDSYLQFHHDVPSDTTRVSLVVPLTNEGAGLMRDELPEPTNDNAMDQTSVLEGLWDLFWSAVILDTFPTGLPEEELIQPWKDKNPEEFLDPVDWRATVLLGTSYAEPADTGVYFVWTDIYPNVVRGDVNGENGVNQDDRERIQQYIEEDDGSDGVIDGAVQILDFATDFRVFDVNQDGWVDALDVALASAVGDHDDDRDVDLSDFRRFQGCFSGSNIGYTGDSCFLGDLDADGDVDLMDAKRFGAAMQGPAE